LSVDLIVVLKTRSKTTMDDAITATTHVGHPSASSPHSHRLITYHFPEHRRFGFLFVPT
jgi:hypothetical protein